MPLDWSATVRQQWPAADPDDVRVMVETIARLAQSHILTPTVSASEIAADLALVACRARMRLPDPA